VENDVCRHDDAMRALEASHDKRFFGSRVTVSIHEGIGKRVFSSSDDVLNTREELVRV